MKNQLKRILLFLLLFVSCAVHGDVLNVVQTGERNSASWQFTNQLSEAWKQKYRDKRSSFVPEHIDGFYKRFQNLDNQQCKLIIAPLKSITELPISGMSIKMVAVLWDVYLAPIAFQDSSAPVSLDDTASWLIPENSLIIPAYLDALHSLNSDSSADLSPELKQFVDSITWPIKESQPDHPPEIQTQFGPWHQYNMTLHEIDEWQETRSSGKAIEILERRAISGLLNERSEGILFYEMLGPFTHLQRHLNQSAAIVSLDSFLIRSLLKHVWFLNSFQIARLGVETVGLTYALFVHEEEDPEFVKELIATLVEPPHSYFPKGYILENLSVGQTREISPLFLHEGSIEFFNID